MAHSLLMHDPNDDVAVAVQDLRAGDEAGAVTLEGQHVAEVELVDDVPLGHKVAMVDMPEGKPVTKYARPIGKTVGAIPRGAHVHTHNLRSLTW
jgi:(2R)-sulfolactate sulfo-lyase subunit alpha